MSGSGVFEVPQQVALALSLASSATGADFDYLMKTAARESNFRPAAVARTSSARGLFQFIEGTWLRTLKEEGAKYGYGKLAKQIFKTRSGRYYVPDGKARRRILKLRNDPKISALMAGAFTRRNADRIRKEFGREPTGGELYIAHFLGAGDAVRMIRLVKSKPQWRADHAFPRAAKANRSIFYSGKRPRSIVEVYRRLANKYHRTPQTADARWSTHFVRAGAGKTSRRSASQARMKKTYVRHAPRGILPAPSAKPPTPPGVNLRMAQAVETVSSVEELLRGSLVNEQRNAHAALRAMRLTQN